MQEVKEFYLTKNAIKVLEKRYLKKNEEGKIVETPEDLFRRVARSVAIADSQYGKSFEEVAKIERDFYQMLTSLEFLPNSPTLMNAGRRLGQLSACFVLPVDDSMESIFDAVKHTAIIHKSGGGTGFSFSRLRPNGDIVGSTKGISSGPVSFMTVFDTATEAVKQGGTRRGANMGILRIDHPDILSFITCKDDNSKFNNFNISVAITDEFMRAVEEDKSYDLINPRTKKVTNTLKARDVFNLIVQHAWKNGEPGIVFIDRVNEANPTPHIGKIESTNPCGEQPLLPYESCNLGSINLAKMLKESSPGNYEVDWKKLKDITWKAVRFLDNVIEINKYPLKKIEETTKANRKIGLGIMGWADMLIQLKIPYNSEKAITLAEEVMEFIQKEGKNASSALAEERGVFPNYEGSIFEGKIKLRNATVTTIAPTGTLSIIAGCSSGIEPLFAVSYIRTVMEGTKLIEINPYFEKVAKEHGFWSRELMERIAEKGSVKDFKEIPADVRAVFVTAHDITPEEHIRMQAAFQKFVDNAVSKTVNFPHDASPKDVEEVYLLAYKLGCKGVTVYRDGSREQQVLSTKKKQESRSSEESVQKIVPKKRPEVIKGSTRFMKTGCGNLYVTINEDEDGHLFELFTSMGKAGGCAASQSEAIGRLVSLAFRSNIEPEEVIKQLKGISCHSPAWHDGGKILSCSDAIAKALEKYYTKGNKSNGNSNKIKMIMGACPECGGAVEHEGGCAVCHNCGFTRCG
ncbi:MAG: vitamin B12-dependent ribonucleotide reductase [Nitrospirae bacterium]|jgi:ribonucleoside-diphosphate reductase alpha chain|nr:vitamin B12-dependent ribonucleotide reductase [Nitrospirota bacterium]